MSDGSVLLASVATLRATVCCDGRDRSFVLRVVLFLPAAFLFAGFLPVAFLDEVLATAFLVGTFLVEVFFAAVFFLVTVCPELARATGDWWV